MAEQLHIHVCYAVPGEVFLRVLSVDQGTTIAQAIEQSGVLAAFPSIDLALQPVGIYGKKRALDTLVREHDRIEIYRPLVADPKESRRRRAEKKTG
jgi:putative ubiquitin-RnfH superfamily antitoxin RatB of RatAB toxin-antitoxin module